MMMCVNQFRKELFSKGQALFDAPNGRRDSNKMGGLFTVFYPTISIK